MNRPKSPRNEQGAAATIPLGSSLQATDPDIAEAIAQEQAREARQLVLIASENYASPAVLQAQGSVLTNKYAEGYPGKRHYGGCRYVDVVERLAVERAKRLFGADHANVQPHSGSQANAAVYFALLQPGDTVMGMELSHGGHLTHGSSVNMSGRWFRIVTYGVRREDELIDIDQLRRRAKESRPKLIIVGASAYPRRIDFAPFREIADEVGAVLMADIAHIAGLVAAKVHPTPVGLAQVITFTTHKTMRGPRGGMILCDADYARRIDRAIFPGTQGGPLMHVVAAKAVALAEALRPEFDEYQRQIVANARALAEELQRLGYRLVTGGTDNHLLMVDLTETGITGLQAERWLEQAGIVVNREPIPFDTRKPWVTSGIRLGTPALTTRGMREAEMRLVAGLIDKVLRAQGAKKVVDRVSRQVEEMCAHFAAPGCPTGRVDAGSAPAEPKGG